MLEIRDLTRRFSGHVPVDDVSLGIPNGQMVRVIGRSGAGKSTLLRMINRLIGRREMAAARAGPAGGGNPLHRIYSFYKCNGFTVNLVTALQRRM